MISLCFFLEIAGTVIVAIAHSALSTPVTACQYNTPTVLQATQLLIYLYFSQAQLAPFGTMSKPPFPPYNCFGVKS